MNRPTRQQMESVATSGMWHYAEPHPLRLEKRQFAQIVGPLALNVARRPVKFGEYPTLPNDTVIGSFTPELHFVHNGDGRNKKLSAYRGRLVIPGAEPFFAVLSFAPDYERVTSYLLKDTVRGASSMSNRVRKGDMMTHWFNDEIPSGLPIRYIPTR